MSIIDIANGQDLVGRILSLNLQICRRFSCGGFSLSQNKPFDVVEPGAQVNQIRAGLLDGRLIDITDQNIKGFGLAGSQHSPVQIEKEGKKVYLQISQNGSLVVVAPKDKESELLMEEEIKEKGVLTIDKFDISPTPLEGAAFRVNTEQASQMIDQFAIHTAEFLNNQNAAPNKKVN